MTDAQAIRAELHDRLMPQLFAAAAAVHAARTRDDREVLVLATESLQKAREIVRQLLNDSPEADEIGDPIDSARRRWDSLAASLGGFTVHWPQPDSFAGVQCTGLQRTAVERIIVESIRNAAAHSGTGEAAVVSNRPSDNAGHWSIQINDQGRGFDVATARHQSHGLTAMTRRAEAAGLSLLITSGTGGTQVTIEVSDRGTTGF